MYKHGHSIYLKIGKTKSHSARVAAFKQFFKDAESWNKDNNCSYGSVLSKHKKSTFEREEKIARKIACKKSYKDAHKLYKSIIKTKSVSKRTTLLKKLFSDAVHWNKKLGCSHAGYIAKWEKTTFEREERIAREMACKKSYNDGHKLYKTLVKTKSVKKRVALLRKFFKDAEQWNKKFGCTYASYIATWEKTTFEREERHAK